VCWPFGGRPPGSRAAVAGSVLPVRVQGHSPLLRFKQKPSGQPPLAPNAAPGTHPRANSGPPQRQLHDVPLTTFPRRSRFALRPPLLYPPYIQLARALQSLSRHPSTHALLHDSKELGSCLALTVATAPRLAHCWPPSSTLLASRTTPRHLKRPFHR